MLEHQVMATDRSADFATIRNISPVGTVLQGQRQRLDGPIKLVEGWAAMAQPADGGELQIISLYLPGDVIGLEQEAAFWPVIALTEVVSKPLYGHRWQAAGKAALALQREYIIRQAVRAAHKSARERTADLLLEIHGRMKRAGLAYGASYRLPLAQHLLASALGMSTVHLNRVLMQFQREGLIARNGGQIFLTDEAQLSRIANFCPLQEIGDTYLHDVGMHGTEAGSTLQMQDIQPG